VKGQAMHNAEEYSKQLEKQTQEKIEELRNINYSQEHLLKLLAVHIAMYEETRKLNEELWEVNRKNSLDFDNVRLDVARQNAERQIQFDEIVKIRRTVLSNAFLAGIKKAKTTQAKKGGDGKSAKLKRLEVETIRMYEAGTWDSAPKAALEITPTIVKISRGGNGDLSPTTTKPLQWIRAFIRQTK
jgi:hypothetical protein